jgi:chorismate mutase / prephenate dehydratase
MDRKERVAEVRAKIASLDRELAQTLASRATLSKEIRGLVEPSGPSLEIDREYLKIIDELPEGDLPKEALRAILTEVAATGRAIERPVRVAYFGQEGGFCYQMVRANFGLTASLTECSTVADALEEVQRQRATICAFPFESSVDGLTMPAVFALAETDLVFLSERSISAMYVLANCTGDGSGISKIYATSAGHAASELFRKREYPNAVVLDVRSPVEAAKRATEEPDAGAVVPEACGREVGLLVVKENVGDEPELKYRYAIVGTRPASRTGNDTTCLLFSLDDAPGTLFQVLGHFAERGINLKKIQSRPVRGKSWDYIFYVEVAGHMTDRAVVTALEAVKSSTKYLKLLGSFPTAA